MPDSAAIGANFSNYTGNAALGGATGQLLDIDTRPLQQLAAYVNLYNKTLWHQRQADTDAKVNQLADLSKISLNDLRGKDKEQATKEFSDLLNYASEYARKTPATSQEKIQQQLEWQTKYGAFLNNFTSGKQRAVAYQAHVNTIMNNTTDASLQDVKLKELNSAFDSTDIGTPISALPQFKMEDISIPKPVSQDIDVVAIGGDQNVNVKVKLYNPALNTGNADATILGLKKAYPQKGTPEYDSLTPNEQQQAEQQATVESQGKIWNDMTVPLNVAIKKYTDADGNFNATEFENDNASNSTLMRAYNALKQMDTYSKDHYNQAVNGIYQDKGLQFKLPPTVNPNDFKAGYVDFSKGVSAGQLAQAGIFSQYEGDSSTKVVTETGKATQLQIAKLNRNSAERINANNIAKDKYIANLPYEKQKLGALGADGQPLDFGNLIYGVKTPAGKVQDIYSPDGKTLLKTPDGKELKDVKINNGVVVDKAGNILDYSGDVRLPSDIFDNAMITEFNKYSGTTKMSADGTVLSSPSTSKLVPQGNHFVVRMQNGEIQGIQADDGTFVSANQMQHITLESAQKVASKYRKADVNYGKQPLTQAQKFLQGLK